MPEKADPVSGGDPAAAREYLQRDPVFVEADDLGVFVRASYGAVAIILIESCGPLAAAFHETIAEVTREMVAAAADETGLRTVCLSGGVFQNRRLASTLVRRLGRDGFEVFINRRVPVNDGGISYGQAAIAAARMAAAGAAGLNALVRRA